MQPYPLLLCSHDGNENETLKPISCCLKKDGAHPFLSKGMETAKSSGLLSVHSGVKILNVSHINCARAVCLYQPSLSVSDSNALKQVSVSGCHHSAEA